MNIPGGRGTVRQLSVSHELHLKMCSQLPRADGLRLAPATAPTGAKCKT